MSGECPVHCPVVVSDKCPTVRSTVRLVSDDVRCKVDSSRRCNVRNVRFGVRSCPKCPIRCPVMSRAVRCCPILSHLLYMVLKHYQNTLSARAKRCVAELGCRSTIKSRCPQNIYEYMDSAQNQYHLLMTSSADSDLTSKFKGTLLMKMVGDFTA